MTKCPNETNNRALGTMETRQQQERTMGSRTIDPETIRSPYMVDNGL